MDDIINFSAKWIYTLIRMLHYKLIHPIVYSKSSKRERERQLPLVGNWNWARSLLLLLSFFPTSVRIRKNTRKWEYRLQARGGNLNIKKQYSKLQLFKRVLQRPAAKIFFVVSKLFTGVFCSTSLVVASDHELPTPMAENSLPLQNF